ncbi:MAG: hypothetical protein HN509_01800 [Halobacteriovoraceae bacterium]|nr:hypothetical protein [Halobacteriovoraceae bacterium]
MIIKIKEHLVHIISETNGVSLADSLELLSHTQALKEDSQLKSLLTEYQGLITDYHLKKSTISEVLEHPFSKAFFQFFKEFPIPFHEEHIHLTGSLSAEFIYPRLKALLEGPESEVYSEKIKEVYGDDALPIESIEDLDQLLRLKEGEQFKTYLKILYIPKLVLNSKQAHRDAAYHMAKELYQKYNVGHIRLKFTLSRSTKMGGEQVPGLEDLTEEDVVFGLYEGFKDFKREYSFFDFILSPSFRKEASFFDAENYGSKKEHFMDQIFKLLDILERHPYLRDNLKEIDTVGDEKDLYKKTHFEEMRNGLRRLQYNGFSIRSHHGETWTILRRGIQSVDNAMNIWHIDTLEHGLSLGINPNFYFHRLFQRVMQKNRKGEALVKTEQEYLELADMEWHDTAVKEKLIQGTPITSLEETSFLKTKFHYAREIEHYQHDVLNRMINKKVSLVALPSSNLKLTGVFPEFKDHPFSWWEKKGVSLGVGTDNYITLSTNYIQEMLILLLSDPDNLKITKLLMLTTREKRRPYISHLLWEMRKNLFN